MLVREDISALAIYVSMENYHLQDSEQQPVEKK